MEYITEDESKSLLEVELSIGGQILFDNPFVIVL